VRQYLGYLKAPDSASGVILVSAVILPVLYVYNGSPEFYLGTVAPLFGLESHPLAGMHAQLYRFAAVLVLFFAIPLLVGLTILRKGPTEFGFCTGDWRLGLKVLAVSLVVTIPLLWVSAGQADFQAEYPMSREAAAEPVRFMVYEAAYLMYYLGWEFMFRGYMLFGLRDRYGPFGAILFQTFPSVLLHIGKPVGETWGAVVVGFALGALALRTRSVLYVLAFHYIIGVVNDLFCAMRMGLIGG